MNKRVQWKICPVYIVSTAGLKELTRTWQDAHLEDAGMRLWHDGEGATESPTPTAHNSYTTRDNRVLLELSLSKWFIWGTKILCQEKLDSTKLCTVCRFACINLFCVIYFAFSRLWKSQNRLWEAGKVCGLLPSTENMPENMPVNLWASEILPGWGHSFPSWSLKQ